jgi:hypothetical protein
MNAEAVVVAVIVGLGTGVVSAFAAWWYLSRRLVPQLKWCPTIAWYSLGEGLTHCQVRIQNQGRRPALDIRVTILWLVPGLVSMNAIETLILSRKEVPYLEGGRSLRWTVCRPDIGKWSLREGAWWETQPDGSALRLNPVSLEWERTIGSGSPTGRS